MAYNWDEKSGEYNGCVGDYRINLEYIGGRCTYDLTFVD